ncbi:hypothetical protein V2J09_004674 [Rumex salicifolius]
MSSPASSPENLPPPDDASPPFLLPLPLGNPLNPPSSLPIPPIPTVVVSPPAPPVDSPASSPSPPSLPPIPSSTPPPESPPLISPPAPALSINPPPPTPELPNNPPSPELPNNPPSPALPINPPPSPALPINPPPSPALPINPPEPALPKNPPSPALSHNPSAPIMSTKPQPPSISIPVNPTPSASAPQPPASTKSPPRQKHSATSKTTKLPSTAPRPAPVFGPASQPATGDDMPLTSEMPAPQPSVPLEVGGGTRPAMAVLPVGANGSSNLRAGTAGGGGPPPAAGVSTGIIAGLCVGGVVLVALLVFGILLVICRRKKGRSFDDCGSFPCNSKSDFQGKVSLPSYTKRNTSFPETQMWNEPSNNSGGSTTAGLVCVPGTVPSSGTFTYEELVAATNGFSECNLLGQGGFGFVHKGVLPNGKEVAVKKLKMGGQQGEREFRAEVDTISQVHHKHLVSLVGYCIAGVERLLVYEFVANKTMEFHLHEKNQPVMNWSTRLKIAVGSAKGLAYLHEDCNPTIIHRDIKAANILLDANCEVKVADFGLAKIFSNTNSSVTHITTRVVGTFGYLAPEYASSGKVTDKSDVYSYGVMLLELITGRPPINTSESAMNGSLVNWARPLLPQAIEEGNYETLVDPRLQNNYNVDEMGNMVACAAACVIRALEGDLSPSDLDDGVRPGQSSMQFPYESLDFDARRYMEDMRKLRLALSSNADGDNTSEYGLQPSVSSLDSHELYTRSFETGRD